MSTSVQEATLRLFNGLPVTHPRQSIIPDNPVVIPHLGFIIDPLIEPTDDTVKLIDQHLSRTGKQWNQTFHKSFNYVRNADRMELFLHQIAHYLTTYTFETAGIFKPQTVYIPHEPLEIPELTEDIPLIFIRSLTNSQITDGIVQLGSGIALDEHTLNDIMTLVIKQPGVRPLFEHANIDKIKNFELLARLSLALNQLPSDPTTILRILVHTATNTSLLIKNAHLIDLIESTGNSDILDNLITKLEPAALAPIFYRFKPIMLALRQASTNKRFFNRVRRLAPKLHEPLKQDYAATLTASLKRRRFAPKKLAGALSRLSIYRKVRLAQALRNRINPDPETEVIRIRNGRVWVQDARPFKSAYLQAAHEQVINSILDHLHPHVEGKTILIPHHINYAFPRSEKAFIGNVPEGTSIFLESDMLFGVHWTNLPDKRVDLDLSALPLGTAKLGWNDRYSDTHITYSGDLTDAPQPDGATEVFHVSRFLPESKPILFTLNWYNYNPSYPSTPMKILVADGEGQDNSSKNHTINPNRIKFQTNTNLDQKQVSLGLLIPYGDALELFLTNAGFGMERVSRVDDLTNRLRANMIFQMKNRLDLNQLLEQAGATIIREADPNDPPDIDLSPDKLDKTTFLNWS